MTDIPASTPVSAVPPFLPPNNNGFASMQADPPDPQNQTQPQHQWVPPTPSEPLWFEAAGTNAMAWFRKNSPAKQPTRWLAGLGSLLLLVAGVAMTAASWRTIPTGARLGGLVIVHFLVALSAERFRKRLPDVANALAHLGAGLFAATGIQAVSTIGRLMQWDLSGGRWPACCLVGGVATLAALEVQHRRWSAQLMRAGQVLAAALAGAGASALTHSPYGVVLAVFAGIAFSVRRPNQAVSFALSALSAPIIGALFEDRWGIGTATRLGTIGPKPLAWAAPLAAAISAVVLALVARERHLIDRKNGRLLVGLAVVGLLYNTVLGISYADITFSFSAYTTAMWLTVVALAVGLRNKALGVSASFLAAPTFGTLLVDLHASNYSHRAASGALVVLAFITLTAYRKKDFILWSSAFALLSSGLYAVLAFEDSGAFLSGLPSGVIMLIWSIAFTIGANARKSDVFEAFGFVGATLSSLYITSLYLHDRTFDLLPLLALAALVGEFVARSRGFAKTKYTYVAGNGVLAIYALGGPLLYASAWRNGIAVVIGVVMIAAGVFSILNAVTMMGVGTLFGALAISFGPAMAELPVWLQFAAGGVVLIGLAVMVERRRELARAISDKDRAEALRQ